MKHRTAELTGALLDAAVALAEGWKKGSHGLEGFRPDGQGWTEPIKIEIGDRAVDGEVWQLTPRPWSTDWNHGGPIIEREHIALDMPDRSPWKATKASASGWSVRYGSTPLIAAMRAYVASKFGDEVDLP
jgi:hypothetical protein